MTYLYCNDRWKQIKQNTMPGPGNYEISRKPNTEDLEGAAGQLQKIFRKNKEGRKLCKVAGEMQLKETVQIQQKMGDELVLFSKKPSTKKGKLYKSSSSVAIMNFIDNETGKNEEVSECKLAVKNITNQPNVHSKNEWGYLRADDILNRCHQNGKKRKNLKTASSSKNFTTQAARESRQRYLEDLKELETIFNCTRKGSSQLATKPFAKNHTNNSTYLNQNKTLKEAEDMTETLVVESKMVYHYQLVSPLHSRPETAQYINPTFNEKMKYVNQQQTLPTRLEDQSFEESVQYIDDATPGPGSYEIKRQICKNRPITHIQKFGVTIDRFQSAKVPSSKSQTQINPKYPKFKKQSKASQQIVGFGRSTKQQLDQRAQCNDLFYEDPNNLEHKRKKMLLKARREKIGFQSCKERFNEDTKKKILDSSSSEQLQTQQKLKDKKQRPSGIFLSKVNREVPINDITEVVDFHGQNYHCLAHKINQEKQHLEDYELQPPAFMGGSQRFHYSEVKQTEKKAQLKLIKIQNLKKREQDKKKSVEKGYSFIKGERNDMLVDHSFRQNNPSPDKYNPTPGWIKDSYNIRFQQFDKK